MILGDCHWPSVLPAILKDVRKRIVPPIIRKIPMTVRCKQGVSKMCKKIDWRTLLTIKFHDVEVNGFSQGSCCPLLVLYFTVLVGLSLGQFPGHNQRRRSDRENDANCAVRPSPVGFVELV